MADIQFKEIENGVAIITPNGHEYVYTVYPWRMDRINSGDIGKASLQNGEYRDVSFNKECGFLRMTKENKRLLSIAKLLANVNSYIVNNDNKKLNDKIKLLIELAYKNQIKDFGCETNLSYYDYNRIPLLANVSNKAISQIMMKSTHKKLTEILTELIYAPLTNDVSSTIMKQLYATNDIYYLNENDLATLKKYNKPITHMIETQDKKIQAVQNDIDAIIRNIPIHLINWLAISNTQDIFKIRGDYNVPSGQIRVSTILPKISDIEMMCKQMQLSHMDYIKGKSYGDFIMDYYQLRQDYKTFQEKYKFELFAKRQHKLPEYSTTMNGHKINLVIPYTYAECQKIGKDFHNCFSEHEWRTFLSTGLRYGCALYKDDAPYICLDIDTETNEIHQALQPCNSNIHKADTIAKVVLKELQNLFNNIK